MILSSLLIVSLAVLSSYFSSLVSLPYMDEYFHYHQSIDYCSGEWSRWNNKITTLPGLYIINVAIFKLTSWLSFGSLPLHSICSLESFRMINLLYSLISYFSLLSLFRSLIKFAYPSVLFTNEKSFVTWKSLELLTLPLLFFFIPFYYTDVCSLAFVLLSLALACRQFHWLSALTALAAIMIRQNNIIWTCFLLSFIVLHRVSPHIFSESPTISSFFHSFFSVLRFVTQFSPFLTLCLPYFMLPVAFFLSFLYWNNGRLTVGDQENHSFSLHLAQIPYFSLVFCSFHWFHIVFNLIRNQQNSSKLRQSILFLFSFSILTPIFYYFITNFTLIHPFLLSDNRHYSFYFIRLITKTNKFNWILACIYSLAALLSYSLLNRSISLTVGKSRIGYSFPPLLQLVLFLLSCAVLVPTPLLEFRYFIVPVILFQLFGGLSYTRIIQDKSNSARVSFDLLPIKLTVVFNLLVNVILLYVFLFRPYTWGDGTTARFMW